MLNALDLFSGIGGNTIGLRGYIKTVAYCEADRHAQSVLLSRMAGGDIEPAAIWDDIKTLNCKLFDIPIDIIIAGFPCQDISLAGNGTGLEGKRSGLFFEVCRLVKEIKPSFVFLENVPAIRTRGLREVVRAFTDLGYDCRWTRLSAAEVGAPHKRERWFLLAYSNVLRVEGTRPKFKTTGPNESSWADGCTVEPGLLRMATRIPHQVERIKRLGNAVVPLQAKIAFERLLGLEVNNGR